MLKVTLEAEKVKGSGKILWYKCPRYRLRAISRHGLTCMLAVYTASIGVSESASIGVSESAFVMGKSCTTSPKQHG
eukprot:4312060-Prymnesium_polylepis.1